MASNPSRTTNSASSHFRAAKQRGSIILKGLVILVLAIAVFGGGAYYTYKLFIEPEQNLKLESASVATMTPPPDLTIPEYQKCLDLKNAHDWVNARAAYEHFLETYPASTKRDAALDDLGEINVVIYFSDGPSPDKDEYVIRPGDRLDRIERTLKVSGDVIMRSNNITDPRRLRVGDTLYVPHPDFTLVIDRQTRLVTLYNHSRYFKRYHPTAWNPPAPKGNPPPIEGKIEDVASYRDGARVYFGSPNYDNSIHQLQVSPPAYDLYTDPSEGGQKQGVGIDLSASDMDELSALITRGVPVTIR
jgi:hypothetical protein